MMQSQVEVLEGKQRALQRYRDRLAQSVPVLRGFEGASRRIIGWQPPSACRAIAGC